MHDEVIRSEQHGALYLLAKRGARFLANNLVGGGQIDEVVGVNDDGRKRCLGAQQMKALDLFRRERARHPPARVAREDLHRVAIKLSGLQERAGEPARDGSV
jgi:hypothetical protein